MITYELAKQLRDAGFPFKQTRSFNIKYFNIEGKRVSYSWGDMTENDPFPKDFEMYQPTLSELIKACKGQLGNLYQTTEGWGTHILGIREPATFGLTPEEAVSLLWLQINKK